MFGSSVEPDLLATITSARERSTRDSTEATCVGSVESSTCRRGPPGSCPNVSARTSGHRLEPPMPSRRRSRMPSARSSAPNPCSDVSSRAMSSGALNHPSHFASSAPVQRLASRLQSRSVLPAASQASAAAMSSPRRGSAIASNVPLIAGRLPWQTLVAASVSSACTFARRRTCRSAPENRAARNVRTSVSASAGPITRAPSTSTLMSSCSTPCAAEYVS